MLKIAITGPESSGKTSLTKILATHFNCPYTIEFSREYLSVRNGKYNEEDLIEILNGQIDLENKALTKKSNFLFCDTDPLVIWIWSKVKYKNVDIQIDELWNSHHYDLYLLVRPDIEWEYDPLRENKLDRNKLFSMYESKLKENNLPYFIIEGDKNKRLRNSIEAIHKMNPNDAL